MPVSVIFYIIINIYCRKCKIMPVSVIYLSHCHKTHIKYIYGLWIHVCWIVNVCCIVNACILDCECMYVELWMHVCCIVNVCIVKQHTKHR